MLITVISPSSSSYYRYSIPHVLIALRQRTRPSLLQLRQSKLRSKQHSVSLNVCNTNIAVGFYDMRNNPTFTVLYRLILAYAFNSELSMYLAIIVINILNSTFGPNSLAL